MINNDLTDSIKVRFTHDQNKALDILKSKGFNKSKFIRQAVEEKLYKDFRGVLNGLKKQELKTNGVPGWAL